MGLLKGHASVRLIPSLLWQTLIFLGVLKNENSANFEVQLITKTFTKPPSAPSLLQFKLILF